MALQTSGPISLANIASQFGGSAPHSLSEYYGAASGIPSSGQISLSQFYGATAQLDDWVVTLSPGPSVSAGKITLTSQGLTSLPPTLALGGGINATFTTNQRGAYVERIGTNPGFTLNLLGQPYDALFAAGIVGPKEYPVAGDPSYRAPLGPNFPWNRILIQGTEYSMTPFGGIDEFRAYSTEYTGNDSTPNSPSYISVLASTAPAPNPSSSINLSVGLRQV